jgi:hypothetical protein
MMPVPRPVLTPFDGLRVLQVGVHARGIVDEPGAQVQGAWSEYLRLRVIL